MRGMTVLSVFLWGCGGGGSPGGDTLGSPDQGLRPPAEDGGASQEGIVIPDGPLPDSGVCGNNQREGAEDCDGTDHGGKTCASFGFSGGTLRCTPACAFDTSLCTACGNGKLDPGEQCDGTELGGKSCKSLGFDGGSLGCTISCTFNTYSCVTYSCGDGQVTGSEECDGSALGGKSCTSEGFLGGSLKCKSNCTLDTSGCYKCGDGKIDIYEQCDGADLGGKTCKTVSSSYDGGTLGCSSSCKFDTSGCTKCGDGKQGGTEQCDGADLGGKSCKSAGFDSGTLKCTYACALDTSGCATCGDGKKAGGEECDGADLGYQSCQGLGYDQGTLKCTSGCTLDASSCSSNPLWKSGSYPFDVRGIWPASAQEIWIVGEKGRIARWAGGKWFEHARSPTTKTLNAAWGSSPTSVWAVGNDGAIAHYDGKTWKSQSAPVSSYTDFYDVWGSSAQDVWAVGWSYSAAVVVHFDGAKWTQVSQSFGKELYGVWGTSAKDIWVVGSAIYHYDGASWKADPTGVADIRAIWGTSAKNIWAAGKGGALYTYNGTAWLKYVSPPTGKDLRSVWGSAANDYWAVGEDGVVLHYDGTTWTQPTTPAAYHHYVVRGVSASKVWIGSDDYQSPEGTLLVRSGATFAPVELMPAKVGVNALFSAGSTSVWAAGANGTAGAVLHCSTTSCAAAALPAGSKRIHALWGSSDSNIYTVGEGGEILHLSGSGWSKAASPTQKDLRAVWGSSAADVWAVGAGGTIVHLESGAWKLVSSPVTTELSSLWGSSASDIWAAGYNTILHYDGAAWTKVNLINTTQSFDLEAMWGSSAGDVWAVDTTHDVLYRFDGSVWGAYKQGPGGFSALYAVHGAGPKEIWVGGYSSSSTGLLSHFDGAGWSSSLPAPPVPPYELCAAKTVLWASSYSNMLLWR